MFLFTNPYLLHKDPWPHLVIDNLLPEDVATHLLNTFPDPGHTEKEQQYYQRRGNYINDPIHKEFAEVNAARQTDIFEIVDDAFEDMSTDEYTLSEFTYRKQPPTSQPTLIKDWHTDLPTKKYHAMIYLGEGEGGWLELLDQNSSTTKRYSYTHNRMILWRNDTNSFHRFWSANTCRLTIGFAIQYK